MASGSIDFDHVYFRYNENGQTWNLEDIDLHIPSGATVGILGGTGSAKTTPGEPDPEALRGHRGQRARGRTRCAGILHEAAARRLCHGPAEEHPCSPAPSRITSAGVMPMPQTRRCAAPAALPARRSSLRKCRRATTPTLSREAPMCPAGKSSGCASPGPFSGGPRC